MAMPVVLGITMNIAVRRLSILMTQNPTPVSVNHRSPTAIVVLMIAPAIAQQDLNRALTLQAKIRAPNHPVQVPAQALNHRVQVPIPPNLVPAQALNHRVQVPIPPNLVPAQALTLENKTTGKSITRMHVPLYQPN